MQGEKKTKRKGLRISRVVLLSIIKIGIPVAVGIIIFIEIFSFIEKKNLQAKDKLSNKDELQVEETVAYVENPLLKDEYPEINGFFKDYYMALSSGNIEEVCTLQDFTSDTEKITIEKKAQYIEKYEDISCYTKAGINEGEYFVFVVSNVKFYDIDEKAPAMTVYYIYKDSNDKYIIQGEMDDKVLDCLAEVYADEEVTDLFNKIDVSYTEAVSSDEKLNEFLAELPGLLKTEVGEALALLEASQMASLSDEEVAAASLVSTNVMSNGSDEVGTVIQVIALDTVNVRKSDSSEADKIGKVSQGQVLTCLEQKINGWSKVLYEGKEAYIKSTYLEAMSSAADGEVIGTVTAKSNVNVRSQASQDSPKLGVAGTGSVYNLLEDLGEWYHIDYNGNNGYVKAEYFSR